MGFEQLRVLELGDDPALAFCGLQLARWGAQVLVGGPYVGDLPSRAPHSQGVSLLWRYLSQNKTIVERDLSELAQNADVILTNVSAKHLADRAIRLGARTIFHRVQTFSPDSSYAHGEGASLLIEAASGFLSINGESDREPLRMPANLVSYVVGAHAGIATLAAIRNRTETGFVESIETTQLDALTTVVPFVRSQYLGRADQRQGGPATGVRLYPIGDGRVSGNLAELGLFMDLMLELGVVGEEVPADLVTPLQRSDHTKLCSYLASVSGNIESEQVFKRVVQRGAARFGLYQTPVEVLKNHQVAALNCLESFEDPVLGHTFVPKLPGSIDSIEPPASRLANSDERPQWNDACLPLGNGERLKKPLEGIRIIDFTQAWIGPFATMMLADLGADVIKVESHNRPDVWRNWRGNLPDDCVRTPSASRYNISPNFNSTNRNKRDIAIDLNRDAGREVAKRLIATGDLVMSNFTPRVMSKFGLDFESVRQLKSDIVYVSWSGYGDVGPYSDYRANGATVEALAGWDALFGYRNGDPMVMGFYQADAFIGLQMANCALIALLQRDLTGAAQHVRGSMLATAISYIGEEVMAASLGLELERRGNRHPDFVPHGVFPTKEQDEWIAIVCRHDDDWVRLAEILNCTHAKYSSQSGRVAAVDEIESLVTDWTSQRTRSEAVRIFRASGVPAAPVLNSLEILEQSEFTRRNWFQRQSHPDVRATWHSGFAWRFESSKLSADRPSPRLGEHTVEILASLGYGATEIDQLFECDAVGSVLNKHDEPR